MLLSRCYFLIFSRISYFAGKKMASICRIPFHESVVKTYKVLYFRTQIKQCNSYTVNKCTPQGHSSPHNPYLFRKGFGTLTCTWTIGIGYPINTETYHGDSTRGHEHFSSGFVSIVRDFILCWASGMIPVACFKKTYTLCPTARASPVASSPSGIPRETSFPNTC